MFVIVEETKKAAVTGSKKKEQGNFPSYCSESSPLSQSKNGGKHGLTGQATCQLLLCGV